MRTRKLTGFWEKCVGLAFKKKIRPVYFQTRWGIHTFFVREPIDVIICDDNWVIRKTVRNLKPWRFLLWNPKFQNVIELPVGFSKFTKIKIGDVIAV